jgi:hypothetical protein
VGSTPVIDLTLYMVRISSSIASLVSHK